MKRSLVVETWNLGSCLRDPARVETELAALLARLGEQSLPLSALSELVVVHDGLGEAARCRLQEVANRAIVWVLVPFGTHYYEQKNLGFDATTAEVVAFTDGDCAPCPEWLERLTAPIAEGEARVIAGPTHYTRGRASLAGTAIDFPVIESAPGAKTVRNFFANNVAFARDVFAAHRYPEVAGLFKGSCQVLALALQREGIPIHFAADAVLEHAWPEGLRELVAMRLLRGADTAAMTPRFAEHYAPRLAPRLKRLGKLPALALLGARAVRASAQLVRSRPGARTLAVGAGVIAAATVVDTVGALAERSVHRRLG